MPLKGIDFPSARGWWHKLPKGRRSIVTRSLNRGAAFSSWSLHESRTTSRWKNVLNYPPSSGSVPKRTRVNREPKTTFMHEAAWNYLSSFIRFAYNACDARARCTLPMCVNFNLKFLCENNARRHIQQTSLPISTQKVSVFNFNNASLPQHSLRVLSTLHALINHK